MPLRARFTEDLHSAMRAGDAARLSTVRMILARIKDLDIAARPKGGDPVGDDDIVAALRAMVKSRHEAASLYRQGGRGELVAKEEAEIALIETYLPAPMDEAALSAAVAATMAEIAAQEGRPLGVRDMGRVMAALRSRHGAALDMARANALAKARLSV